MRAMRISDVDHRTPLSQCPLCGHKLDAGTGVGMDNVDQRPDPGDYGVCINCASPLVYNDDLTMRAMTGDEWHELHPENRDELRAAMATVRQLNRR
jgi:hypothetical protein